MFTDQGLSVLDHLIHAWNVYVDLPVLHPEDRDEFRHAVHATQNIVLARVGLRAATKAVVGQ